MNKRLVAAALLSLALLAFTSGQNWFAIKTTDSPVLEFTGAETSTIISPILALVALTTLTSLYLKSWVAAGLHTVALLGFFGTVVTVWSNFQAENLSAVANKIEIATGVAEWPMQRTKVVTSIEPSVWPVITGLVALVLLLLLCLMLLGSLKTPKSKVLDETAKKGKEIQSQETLWSETSGHL